MGQCYLAKTANRSVVGTMNEFASLAKFGKDDGRITDEDASLRLFGPRSGARVRVHRRCAA